MSPDQDMREEREGIELLLPWYAAGTLEPDELRRVEAYLRDHPELEDHLTVVREELEETVSVNEAIGSPSAGAMDRLMAQVEQESPQAFRQTAASGGLLQGILDWFENLTPRTAAFGAALAIAIICAQAVTLSVVTSGGGGKTQTATGPGQEQVLAGTFALVRFAPTASMAEVNALLAGEGASIVDGPRSGGVYRVRLAEAELSDADRDAALERISASPLVLFAGAEG